MIPGIIDIKGIKKVLGSTTNIIWERQLELGVSILSPTEGQEVTGDVNITFEILGETGINILTPTEGEEITGDVNITFEIL